MSPLFAETPQRKSPMTPQRKSPMTPYSYSCRLDTIAESTCTCPLPTCSSAFTSSNLLRLSATARACDSKGKFSNGGHAPGRPPSYKGAVAVCVWSKFHQRCQQLTMVQRLIDDELCEACNHLRKSLLAEISMLKR